ncbi:MAG TPA: VWA domain-containing protein [Vicinamibacterales bacterium]|nr:VWA domain-containing protein [Vicinamibacterales bacterium]
MFSVFFASSVVAIVVTAQQPTFRAGIDLLAIDASVVDAKGTPVTDLSADDFTAVVDGQPRRVVSVRFLEDEMTAKSATNRAALSFPIPMHARNGFSGGRIVLFVVDRDSIGPGSERALLEAAGSVLDVLGSGDAAGAVSLPASSVELTREHDRVRSALLRMTGARPPQMTMWRERQLSWEEALAYERQDPLVIAQVVERECYGLRPDDTGLKNMCPDQLRDQARELLLVGRGQVRQSLASLRSLVTQLASLRGTKQVILLSAGMPFGFDLAQEYANFTNQAADAGIVIHAVNVEEFEAGAATARKVVSSPFGGREHAAGLGAISAGTGGAFYMGVGSARGVFDRLASELASFYQVGVETLTADRAGSLKQIEIAVKRPGLSVRSVRRAAVPGAPVVAGTDPLATLLQQPTDLADLPLAVGTYTMRGDDDSALRVVIATEVGDARARPPMQWGFAVFNEGNVVATSRQRFEAAGPVNAGAISAKLLPGQYRLRVAAIDGEGRPGVTDLPLSVGLRAAGDLQFSDLMVGVADANGRVQARASVPQGTALAGIVEVMSADPAIFERVRTVFEIAPPGTEPMKRFVMGARSGAAPTILLNQVQMPTADFVPGRYIVSAVPHLDDKPVGRVSRLIEITAP